MFQLLLLSGPPGLGKTTLAHIVAQHAGYGVFETNASDERSGNVIENRIRPALESGAKIGSSKPNLVVIDEIDGAIGGADSVRTLTVSPKRAIMTALTGFLHQQTYRANIRQTEEERWDTVFNTYVLTTLTCV